MKKLTKKEALQIIIDEIKLPCVKYKFICNQIEDLYESKKISENMRDNLKGLMKPKKVPIEFRGENWTGGYALWQAYEIEMRVVYLEYLIENL